jgi:hypothetical protein
MTFLVTKLLTRDEARRIAANIAQLSNERGKIKKLQAKFALQKILNGPCPLWVLAVL